MSYASAAIAIAAMWLIGAAITVALCAEARQMGRSALLGNAFAAGLATCTLFGFALSCVGVALSPWPLGAAAMALGWLLRRRLYAAFGQDVRGRGHTVAATSGWERAISRTLAGMMVAWCAVVFVLALLEPIVEWDVMAIWAYKARILLFEPVLESGYFHDVTRTYSHPDYPLLWPLAMRLCWPPNAALDLSAVKLLGPAVFIAILLTFQGRLHSARTPLPLLFGAVLAALPMLQSQAIRLMADVPLALMLLCLVCSVHAFLRDEQPAELRLGGLFAAGLLFTKNEGIGLWGVVIAATALALIGARRRRALVPALLWLAVIPGLLTAPWFVFRSSIPKLHENLGSLTHTAQFFSRLERLPELARLVPRYLLAPEDWMLFWPLAALSVLLGARALLRPATAFVGMVLAGAGLLYGYIYLITPWQLADLIDVSVARLALHVAPVALLLAHECCAARIEASVTAAAGTARNRAQGAARS